MSAFLDFLYHLLVEGGKVVRCPAGHQALVHHDFFIAPDCPCIDHVVLYRGEGSDASAFQHICVHKDLRSVADGRNRLVFVEKIFDEGNCFLIAPQLVGIDNTPWENQGVVVF